MRPRLTDGPGASKAVQLPQRAEQAANGHHTAQRCIDLERYGDPDERASQPPKQSSRRGLVRWGGLVGGRGVALHRFEMQASASLGPMPSRTHLAPAQLLVLGLAAACALTACGPPETPETALSELQGAQSRRDQQALEARLSPDARRELRASGGQLDPAVARALATLPAQPSQYRVKLTLEDGRTLLLTQREGTWQLAQGAWLDVEPQSPEAALAALRLSLLQRNSDGLWLLLTRRSATELERDALILAAELERPRELIMTRRESEAEAQTPSGRRIQLRFEAGAWRVEWIK